MEGFNIQVITVSRELQAAISWYLSRGMIPVPAIPSEKRPAGAWANVKSARDAMEMWRSHPEKGIGILTGPSRILVLDLDLGRHSGALDSIARHIAEFEGCPEHVARRMIESHPALVRTWSGGLHLYFRLEDGEDWPPGPSTIAGIFPGVDVRGRGGFVVAPPTEVALPAGAGRYEWVNRPKTRSDIPFIPLWLHDLLRSRQGQTNGGGEGCPTSPTAPDTEHMFTPKTAAAAAEHYLQSAISRATIGTRNEIGLWLATQIRDLRLDYADAENIMLKYARAVPQNHMDAYTEKEALATLKSAYSRLPRSPAIPRSVLPQHPAWESLPPDDYEPGETVIETEQPKPGDPPDYLVEQDLDFEIAQMPQTDQGNAEVFARLYGDRYRFEPISGHWYFWDNSHWRRCPGFTYVDDFVAAMRRRARACETISDANAREAGIRWAVKSTNMFRIEGGLRRARMLPSIVWARDTALDSDPLLVAAKNGVIDLKTGALRPGRPDDLITRCLGYEYHPGATAPRFEQFLNEVFDGDKDTISYIRRAVGYSLTGLTTEQVLFLLHGHGANGKSVFLITLWRIFGSYAAQTPFSTFELSQSDRHTNDLAMLRGRRLVIASETQEGRRLDEGRVKAVTGGDPITARFLYGEFFTFIPSFKVWLAANHRPVVTGTDTGVWRRIHLVPFEVYFPPEKQDRHLADKLIAEAPGIIAWAVKGCLEWRERGLDAPATVLETTEAYRKDQDTLSDFFATRTKAEPGAVTRVRDLWNAYRAWAEDAGIQPVSLPRFGRMLGDRGYKRQHREHGNAVLDIVLI